MLEVPNHMVVRLAHRVLPVVRLPLRGRVLEGALPRARRPPVAAHAGWPATRGSDTLRESSRW